MTRVLIQPASELDARKHYRDTIEQPVQFDDRLEIPADLRAALVERYPSGEARMWGDEDVTVPSSEEFATAISRCSPEISTSLPQV
jgi:hypothetical protein